MADFKKSTVIYCLLLFAAMSPLGAFLAESISFDIPTQIKIMAIVIGSFLHISTTILFETDNTHQHKIPVKRVAAILTGIGLASLTVWL